MFRECLKTFATKEKYTNFRKLFARCYIASLLEKFLKLFLPSKGRACEKEGTKNWYKLFFLIMQKKIFTFLASFREQIYIF